MYDGMVQAQPSHADVHTQNYKAQATTANQAEKLWVGVHTTTCKQEMQHSN